MLLINFLISHRYKCALKSSSGNCITAFAASQPSCGYFSAAPFGSGPSSGWACNGASQPASAAIQRRARATMLPTAQGDATRSHRLDRTASRTDSAAQQHPRAGRHRLPGAGVTAPFPADTAATDNTIHSRCRAHLQAAWAGHRSAPVSRASLSPQRKNSSDHHSRLQHLHALSRLLCCIAPHAHQDQRHLDDGEKFQHARQE